MRPEAALIDISQELSPNTPVFPGDPPVVVEDHFRLGQAPFHVSRVALGSHSGTHLDAPAHFIAGGQRLFEIPLARLCGPAWVVEVGAAGPIEPAALEAVWPPSAVERLLIRTSAPGLSTAAADWLVTRGVRLVGIDAPSIEAGDDFPVHRTLLGSGVLILEGLVLEAVAPGPYELLCLPLKLSAPDGAPVRAVLRPIKEAP